MIDTGLLVVLTITFTMLLSVLILLSYDFEEWCPQVLTTTVPHLYSSELTQVYSALFNSTVSIFKKNPLRKKNGVFQSCLSFAKGLLNKTLTSLSIYWKTREFF